MSRAVILILTQLLISSPSSALIFSFLGSPAVPQDEIEITLMAYTEISGETMFLENAVRAYHVSTIDSKGNSDACLIMENQDVRQIDLNQYFEEMRGPLRGDLPLNILVQIIHEGELLDEYIFMENDQIHEAYLIQIVAAVESDILYTVNAGQLVFISGDA